MLWLNQHTVKQSVNFWDNIITFGLIAIKLQIKSKATKEHFKNNLKQNILIYIIKVMINNVVFILFLADVWNIWCTVTFAMFT